VKPIVPPPGWTKTTSDLEAEDRLGMPLEWQWAIAYERQELRKWAHFPRHGEVYEALNATRVQYTVKWNAPVTSGGEGVIPKGTRVRVTVCAEDPEPIAVDADPLEYERIERELVSEVGSTKYAGFSLFIKTKDLNQLYRLIESHSP
jgi:hypothetical protein